MATIIKYNGSDPFSDLAVGTPLVARNYNPVYTNERHGIIDSFVLSGRIKRDDCTGGFQSIKEQVDELINRFSYNFKSFQIETDSQVVYNANYAIVRSIRIDESNFFNLVPFSIQIDIISDTYVAGILEPEEIWSYEDNGDCTVTITHTISARGVNTSIQALDSAKDFVRARAGYSGANYSQTFTFVTEPILQNRRETVDRLSGKVSLVETYLYGGINPSSNCVTTYTIDVSQRDGQTDISISGSVRGGENNNMTVVRNSFETVDWYSLAADVFLLYNPVDNLPEQPISYSETVNSEEKVLSFQFRYSDSVDTDIYLIDSTTINRDLISGITCIEYRGLIKANGSCGANRWMLANNYFNSLNIDSIVAQKWATYGSGGRLAAKPKSKTITHDEFNGQISFTVSYCDSNKEDCGCLQDFDYNLSFKPALPVYSDQPTLDGEGCHYIEDLNGLSRAQFQINGRAKSSFCCSLSRSVSELKTRLNLLCNKYFGGTDKILESSTISEDQNSNLIDFSCSWSATNNLIVPSYLLEVVETPLRFAPMSLWLDMSKLTVSNGSNIELLTDYSSNGFNLTQSSSSRRATFNSTGKNNKGIAEFDGVDDFYFNTGDVWPSDEITFFYVFAAGSSGEHFSQSTNVGGNLRFHFYNNSVGIKRWTNGPEQIVSNGTWALVSYWASGSSENMSLNGGNTLSGSSRPSLTAQDFVIGSLYNGSPLLPQNLKLAELIIYPRVLNSTERRIVEEYLQNKWATPDLS